MTVLPHISILFGFYDIIDHLYSLSELGHLTDMFFYFAWLLTTLTTYHLNRSYYFWFLIGHAYC